jgi:hypothetical protein
MDQLLVVVTIALAGAAWWAWRALRKARQAEFVRGYSFPKGLFDKLQARHPALTLKDCQLVAQALRQFFGAYLQGGCRPVAMPSQVVDDLWHEFILHTRNYEHFCRQAFGGFMHHTPAVAMGGVARSNAGLRRCWWHCCRAEHINPRAPTRLPLLFAIDAKLHIAGGFHYVPDCGPLKAQGDERAQTIHCGGEFSDAGFDGGTEGLGDGAGDGGTSGGGGGGDGGGDGGGCSGGGCSSD